MSGASIPGAVHWSDACPPRARGVTHLPVRPSKHLGSLSLAISAHTWLVVRYPTAGRVPSNFRIFRLEIIRTPPFCADYSAERVQFCATRIAEDPRAICQALHFSREHTGRCQGMTSWTVRRGRVEPTNWKAAAGWPCWFGRDLRQSGGLAGFVLGNADCGGDLRAQLWWHRRSGTASHVAGFTGALPTSLD